MSQRYDFVIAGGGAAGLSLACHLARSPLRERSILIVDRDARERNDRTWCFWANQPTLFDDVAYRTWSQLQVVGEDFEKIIDLRDYRYQMIRGIDFYRFARQELSAQPNVTFLQGVVKQVEDGADEARVTVDGQTISGEWVFDSLFRPSEGKPSPAGYHRLNMRFQGWEIDALQPAFNPQAATFLDFRTPQKGDARFFYVLPLSERRALVEYTLFSTARLSRDEAASALKAYLETALGLRGYSILSQEGGSLPVTDQPFPRRTGRRIMTLGVKGGRLKPTTGFAFQRIQRDSAAIVQSLLQSGQPFDVPADSGRYRLYDALMLEVMSRHGGEIKPIFTAMFKRNPIERIFRFLDEAGSPWENLRLIATLPPRLFVQALFRSNIPSPPDAAPARPTPTRPGARARRGRGRVP